MFFNFLFLEFFNPSSYISSYLSNSQRPFSVSVSFSFLYLLYPKKTFFLQKHSQQKYLISVQTKKMSPKKLFFLFSSSFNSYWEKKSFLCFRNNSEKFSIGFFNCLMCTRQNKNNEENKSKQNFLQLEHKNRTSCDNL